MAAGTRRVVWGESAQAALAEAPSGIAETSRDGATRVMTCAVEVADSLSTLTERGRVVPGIGGSTFRELFFYEYRLLDRVREDRVVIRAFLHGARDFSTWQREQGRDR